MGYIHTIFIPIIAICCIKCFASFRKDNQQFYNKIVDYFFPEESGIPKIEMDQYLCFLKKNTSCSCTKTCRYYGTCCIDAFFNSNVTSVKEYVDIFRNMTKIKKHVKKLPAVNFKAYSVKVRVEKLPMVASCDNRESPYTELCNTSDPKNDIRVIADGFVYKNKHCALCHGFQLYNLAPLTLVGCNNRIKISGAVSTIPDESCTLHILNQGYNVKAYLENLLYQINLFIKFDDATLIKDFDKPHFRLLIDYDNHCRQIDTGYPICQSNQYFDITDTQCKNKPHAKPKSVFPNPNPITQPQPPPQLSVENKLSPSLKAVKKTFRCIKRIGGITIKMTGFPKTMNFIHFPAFFRNYTEVSTVRKQFKDFLLSSRESNDMILVPHKQLPFTELYGFSPKHHFSHGRVCADPEIINQTFKLTPDCNISVNNIAYNINKDVTYWINVTNGHINHVAARCSHFHLIQNCSMRIPNMSLVTIRDNSLTVEVNKEKKTFIPEQYFPLIEGFRVCLEIEKEYVWLKQYYHFENLLSHIFLSISLSLELLFLTVYLVWKKPRKTPQKNLIAFCIALFACDITGLILPLTRKTVHGITCKIVALLLHFFSLALCTWSCIVAYEVWLILRSRNVNNQSNYLYFRYSMVAWGTPCMVTSVCLTVDLVSNGSLIRYGNQDYCWIFPFHARLAVYIVPLTLITCGNSFLLSFIVIKTRREKRAKHTLLAKNDKLKFHKMIIKLFLLFGTAELIGLVQIPNATQENQLIVNVIFGRLHNFFRSSRGIFLFLIFGCNTIIKKYREQTQM